LAVVPSGIMLPETCVVVPTYWTRAGGETRPGDAVYDHPTSVDQPGTLAALLESLAKLDVSRFYLLLLVAVTGGDVAADAERRAAGLVESFPSIRSIVFGPSRLVGLHRRLTERKLPGAGFLDLRTYPKVRNLQLAIPYAVGSRAVVALDDDEIVIDPAFLEKATQPLGSEVDGMRVDGLSGHYEQGDGSILLRVDSTRAESRNIFDRKAAIMNDATARLEQKHGDLVPTPFCFGGNMEFTAELAAAVGFDPEITRGEDIDYLINARMEGRNFFLRKDLRILHCPPQGGSYKDLSLSKLEQDVVRFLYEREKLQVSQQHPELTAVNAADLVPYPGDFFAESLETDARSALEAAGYPGDAAMFVQNVMHDVPRKVERYLEFRKEWPRTLSAMRADPWVSENLVNTTGNS